MKANLIKNCLVASVVLVGWALPVTAGYIPDPIKWSQPIQLLGGTVVGTDHLSDETRGQVLADDFQCTSPSPIVAVRWWGSYIGDPNNRGNGLMVPFDISFHFSTGSHPFSLPQSDPLYYHSVYAEQDYVGLDQAGDAVYEYDAYLTIPFNQVPGTEYFMDIDNHGNNWGWSEANPNHPILDWAATGLSHTGPWSTYQPNTDLAFELMIPEPATGCIACVGAGLLFVLRAYRRRH